MARIILTSFFGTSSAGRPTWWEDTHLLQKVPQKILCTSIKMTSKDDKICIKKLIWPFLSSKTILSLNWAWHGFPQLVKNKSMYYHGKSSSQLNGKLCKGWWHIAVHSKQVLFGSMFLIKRKWIQVYLLKQNNSYDWYTHWNLNLWMSFYKGPSFWKPC